MDEHQMDTDGGHDRAARRRELKREWKKEAAEYCKRALYPSMGKPAKLSSMLAAYAAWKAAN